MAKELIQADFEAIRNNCDLLPEESAKKEQEYMQESVRTEKHIKLALFNKLMDENRIFLQCEIRANDVSILVHTNCTYFSRMIKEEFHCTFVDYINRKRIESSQQLMRENPTIKSADLTAKSGFSDINSFGRVFKQTAGLPPK